MAVHSRRARRMRKAIAELDEVLVIALVSKTVMPVRVPTGQSLRARSWSSLRPTRSRIRLYCRRACIRCGRSSTARRCGLILSYTPSDVFETFPRPKPTDRLAEVGTDARHRAAGDHAAAGPRADQALQPGQRSRLRRRRHRVRGCGEIHVELDQAVMDAYGWGDVRARPRVPHLPADAAVDRLARPRGWRSWTGCSRRTCAGPPPRAKRRRPPRTKTRGTTR